MSKPFVAILMGSDSDLPAMQATFKVLKSFDITYEVRIHSAHRTREATHDYVTEAENAAYLAAQIMVVSDESLAQKLRDERAANKEKILARNAEVQKELSLA